MSVIFPKWLNALPTVAAVGGLGGTCALVGGVWYWATPEFWEVGYMPTQSGSGFNHQLHAGKLGLDCRYCHTNVETSPEANIPSVSACFGCHADQHVSAEFARVEKTAFVREAWEKNESIPWDRVHKLPDYVRNFPHNVHVKAGVSCFSCHGQITGMPVVYQRHSLSMSWCLSCHRDLGAAMEGNGNPAERLVPRDQVTNLFWVEEQWMKNAGEHAPEAKRLLEAIRSAPPENCGACHF